MLVVYTYMQALKGRLTEDRGATAVEYGLMVALIAVVIAGTVLALGGELNNLFTSVKDCLATPSGCSL